MKGQCNQCNKKDQILNNMTKLCEPCLRGNIMNQGIEANQIIYVPKSEQAKWDTAVENLTGRKPSKIK